jgi:DNA invertase Pin-like site-specific DNA recombinase
VRAIGVGIGCGTSRSWLKCLNPAFQRMKSQQIGRKKQARPVGCSWASTTPRRAAVSVPIAERPAGGRLFAKLKKGDIVIAPKLDRLFRSALDALQVVEDLKKRGVSLHLLDLGGSRPFRL